METNEACALQGREISRRMFFGQAASLQIIASIPNAELLEYCEQDTPIRHDLVPDDIPAIDGYATVPTKPGLGIEVSDEAIEFYRCDNP